MTTWCDGEPILKLPPRSDYLVRIEPSAEFADSINLELARGLQDHQAQIKARYQARKEGESIEVLVKDVLKKAATGFKICTFPFLLRLKTLHPDAPINFTREDICVKSFPDQVR